MVATGFRRPRRPINISDIMTGMPIRMTHRRYTMTKAPPPFWPATYGNFQTFPSPTAEPVTARMKAILDDHWPCSDSRLAGSVARLLSIIHLSGRWIARFSYNFRNVTTKLGIRPRGIPGCDRPINPYNRGPSRLTALPPQ